MNLLSAYKDDSDEEVKEGEAEKKSEVSQNLVPKMIMRKVDAAPQVALPEDSRSLVPVNASEVRHNPAFDSLWAPVIGPVDPSGPKGPGQVLDRANRNTLAGFVEDAFINDHAFDEQFHTFYSYGYATNPNNNQEIVGDVGQYMNNKGATVFTFGVQSQKKKRVPSGDPGSDHYLGPWAPYLEEKANEEKEEAERKKQRLEDKEREKEEREKEKENKDQDKDKDKEDKKARESEETSIFHGKEEKDYLGRSYIHAPSELKEGPHQCYTPKKQIHTWVGHSKGVHAIRFFPRTGHLLLSASMDNTVKLWDVYNDRRCLRTFIGHNKPVRDICFTRDGTKFISSSFDTFTKLWDTETGQCISRFSTRRIPYCCKFYPENENEFLTGCSDKKIIQWDIRSHRIMQEYDQHLAAVNTITFVDDNRRFVTSSDDKSLRVWEYGIPVVIKYISEPHMHSMPSIALHPNGKWFAAQSLDNQILIYSTRERFKLNKKKRFVGHVVAGYACQISFSPDGKFLISGDGDGRVWYWDWKTTKVIKKLPSHQGVSIGCIWHPIEPSRVATCGWDGRIHYWD